MRLARLCDAIGEQTPLATIDQDVLTRLRDKLLKPDASPATFAREIVEPFRAVLRYAARQGWCPEPHFISPKRSPGRTLFLMPAEAERLIAKANTYLKPLLVFLLGTGARVSEALELEWRDIDLAGRRALLWKTKSGRRRIASLPGSVIAALSALPHREGAVFRSQHGSYTNADRGSGGQFRKAWVTALRGADLDPKFTPHVCRHTFATWHYALHRDLLALKAEGGWATVTMVERYAKLMPAGYEAEIRRFLGDVDVTDLGRQLPLLATSY
jgi:integrase